MNQIQAWHKIFSLVDYRQVWVKIPSDLIAVTNLPKNIGLCGNVLCTKTSAIGAKSFVDRLNSVQERIK